MRMRPTVRPISKKEAQQHIDAFQGVVKNVKSYGKNVVGGAKIVGSAIKSKLTKKK